MQYLILVLIWLFTVTEARNLAELPVKLSLIYYEIEGKGANPNYRFKMDPIHHRAPCEQKPEENDCQVTFEFSRCPNGIDADDANTNSSCSTTTIEGLPKTSFFTCDPKVKRFVNGLSKQINGTLGDCLTSDIGGHGTAIDVTLYSRQVKVATTSLPLGRGRQMTQTHCDVTEQCRAIKFMVYQDDVDSGD